MIISILSLSMIIVPISGKNCLSSTLDHLMSGIGQSENEDFEIDAQNVLRYRGRICVPEDEEMRKAILEEGHRSKLSIHPGATKMYQDRSSI